MDRYRKRFSFGENPTYSHHIGVFATSPEHAEAACRFLLGLLRTSDAPQVYFEVSKHTDQVPSELVTMFLKQKREGHVRLGNRRGWTCQKKPSEVLRLLSQRCDREKCRTIILPNDA